MEDMAKRQPDVDRICKPKRVSTTVPPGIKDRKASKASRQARFDEFSVMPHLHGLKIFSWALLSFLGLLHNHIPVYTSIFVLWYGVILTWHLDYDMHGSTRDHVMNVACDCFPSVVSQRHQAESRLLSMMQHPGDPGTFAFLYTFPIWSGAFNCIITLYGNFKVYVTVCHWSDISAVHWTSALSQSRI